MYSEKLVSMEEYIPGNVAFISEEAFLSNLTRPEEVEVECLTLEVDRDTIDGETYTIARSLWKIPVKAYPGKEWLGL